MSEILGRRVVSLGEIDYLHNGRKSCPVTLEIELRECGGEPTFYIVNGERVYTGKCTPVYTELAICGNIWNHRKTDIYCGGQCLDTIAEYVKGSAEFEKIYRWWKLYHLNGMHAGTPAQEIAVRNSGLRDYEAQCEYLRKIGLYEVMWRGEKYRYGTKWLHYEIPESDMREIRKFLGI